GRTAKRRVTRVPPLRGGVRGTGGGDPGEPSDRGAARTRNYRAAGLAGRIRHGMTREYTEFRQLQMGRRVRGTCEIRAGETACPISSHPQIVLRYPALFVCADILAMASCARFCISAGATSSLCVAIAQEWP